MSVLTASPLFSPLLLDAMLVLCESSARSDQSVFSKLQVGVNNWKVVQVLVRKRGSRQSKLSESIE